MSFWVVFSYWSASLNCWCLRCYGQQSWGKCSTLCFIEVPSGLVYRSDKAFATAHGGISSAPTPCHSLPPKRNAALRFMRNLIMTTSSYHLIFSFPPLACAAGLQNGNAAERFFPATWGLQLIFQLYSLTSTAPPAGKAVPQTTFQSKAKYFVSHTSCACHHFQLMASFSQGLHIQMAGSALSAFLAFFLLLSCPFVFPPCQFCGSYCHRPYLMQVEKLWHYLKQM